MKKYVVGIVHYGMTIDEAITLMRNEIACVLKADTCDRDCAKCELVRKTEDLLSAYNLAIQALEQTKWIPCSERMPEEHEWIGTKKFGTTISDEVYVTFENPEGNRFVKHLRFQNGKPSSFDQSKIDAFYKGSVPIAWMPLPEPYDEIKELPPVTSVPKKCHNENHDYAECDQFVCSNCGIELQDWHRVERDIDTGDIIYHQYEFKYCPNCGAKIGEDKRTLEYSDQDTMMPAT